MLKGKVVALREKQFPLLLLSPSIITITLTVYLNSSEVKSLTKGRFQGRRRAFAGGGGHNVRL